MPAGSCTQGHLERALAARGLHVPAHRPQGNRTCPDSSTCRLLCQAKSRQPLGRRQKPPRSAANTRWRMRPGSHPPAALPYRSPGTSQRWQAYNTLAEGSPEAVAAAAVGPGWVGTARCRRSAGRRPRGTAARTMGAKRQAARSGASACCAQVPCGGARLEEGVRIGFCAHVRGDVIGPRREPLQAVGLAVDRDSDLHRANRVGRTGRAARRAVAGGGARYGTLGQASGRGEAGVGGLRVGRAAGEHQEQQHRDAARSDRRRTWRGARAACRGHGHLAALRSAVAGVSFNGEEVPQQLRG